MKEREEYIKRVKLEFENYCSRNRTLLSQEEIDHIISIGVSILQTRDGGIQGGSFVQAVVNNDLSGTYGRADYINRNFIPFYITLKDNVRI